MKDRYSVKNEISFDLKDFYDDEKDIIQDYEYIKSLINLRDFQCIFSHHIIIEREITFFLANDFPNSQPYYDYLILENLVEFKNEINNCKPFSYEKLNLDKTIINELNSLINNNIPRKEKEKALDSNIFPKKSYSFEINIDRISLYNDEKISSAYSEIKPNIKKIGKKNIKKKGRKFGTKNNQNSQITSKTISSCNSDNSKRFNNSIKDSKKSYKNDDIIFESKDFRAIKDIDNIPFNYYTPDVNVIGKSYEGEIINNIYDIFNALTMRKLVILKNQNYRAFINGENTEYELDFQITNLSLKDFLFFIGLIFPNIATFDTLDDSLKKEISNIFENKEIIFENIKKFEVKKELKKYEFIDIIGEITIDLFNTEYKKNRQINKYFTLAKELEKNENKNLNKIFHFSPNNKKFVIIITNGIYDNFYNDYIKVKGKDNKLIKDKSKNINHIYIYIKSYKAKHQMIEEKLKIEYINLLENALKEKEKKSKEKNGKIETFQSLKFSELYNTFYKHILINSNIQALRKGLSYMNKKFINSIPSLYFSYLNKKIDKNKVKEIFLQNINLNINFNYEYIGKIKKEFQNIKDEYIPSVSIFEITSQDLMFKNMEKNINKIINYKGIKYEQNTQLNFNNIKEEFDLWLIENEYSIKIVIYNTYDLDINIHGIFYILDYSISKDFVLVINDDLEKYTNLFKIIYYTFKYAEKFQINIDKIIEIEKYGHYLLTKMNFQYNYFDKILKKRLIVQNKDELENKDFLNLFIDKINQDISIYASMNITNINDIFFDAEKIKKNINELNQFRDNFISDEKHHILKKFNNKNSFSDFINANINIEEALEKKFNNYKENLNLIYYKFIEVYYDKAIKKLIKKEIINNYIRIN